MSEIKKWYAGQNILITGATGLIGKCLVYKLLKDCSDIGGLYLMVRSKKNENVEQRKIKYLNHFIFENIRGIATEKIKVFEGSLDEKNLGISEIDRENIYTNISIIFHIAASVRFDMPLVTIYQQNVLGTKYLLELASNIKQLKVFVYVSTCFSQLHGDILREKYYPPVYDDKDMFIKIDENIINILTPKLLMELPNTYAFSKNLAEASVYKYKDKFRIVVCRPSIVCPAYKEPRIGFTEGLHGPNGWGVLAGLGVIKTTHCDGEISCNMICVDTVVNAIIVSAYVQGSRKECDDILYFNINRSIEYNFTWNKLADLSTKCIRIMPFQYSLTVPGGHFHSTRFIHMLVAIFQQLSLSIIGDIIMLSIGKKPILMSAQRKIFHSLNLLDVYFNKEFRFDTSNFEKSMDQLNVHDKKIFYSNNNVSNEEFVRTELLGLKLYILKEKMEDLPKALAFQKKLIIFYTILKLFFIFCILKFFFAYFDIY